MIWLNKLISSAKSKVEHALLDVVIQTNYKLGAKLKGDDLTRLRKILLSP